MSLGASLLQNLKTGRIRSTIAVGEDSIIAGQDF